MEKFAGIDIGSNAMRLIIDEVVQLDENKEPEFSKLLYLRLPIRLGGDVFTKGFIDQAKQKEFLKGMCIYKELMEYFDVSKKYRACATSAMRTSSNGIEMVDKISKLCGINIEIIDGQEEAEILFKLNRKKLKEHEVYMSVDLGGGSVQTTIFENNSIIWTESFPIGTVRLLNDQVTKDTWKYFENTIKEKTSKFDNIHLIGTGGNINKISTMSNEKNLEISDFEKIYNDLNPLTVAERMKQFDLREDRADVIVHACEVFMKLMKLVNVKKIFVPKAGLADGIISQLYENGLN